MWFDSTLLTADFQEIAAHGTVSKDTTGFSRVAINFNLNGDET